MSTKYKLLVAITVSVLAIATTACSSLNTGQGYTWNEIEQERADSK